VTVFLFYELKNPICLTYE